ncbi:MAG: LLM class flavin-dependent oxidoreductase [Chloroflexi bacterium]|nr:LLM class flavin-dependent oxidoreductase [Chloroflexota bacterium]
MKVGLSLSGMTQQPRTEDIAQRYQEVLARVRLARDVGFDFVYLGHHYVAHPYQMFHNITLAARLAAEAPEMGVVCTVVVPTYHPVELAEGFATLDIVTGGKAVLSCALGYRGEEYAAFGVDPKQRVSRFVECLTLVKRLWTEEEVTFQGKHFRLSGVRPGLRPLQRPHPPVWIAANSDAAVRRAAVLGCPWFVNPHAALSTIRRQVELYRQACNEAGRPILDGLPMGRECCVAPTREEAFRTAAPFLGGKYETYAQWGQDRALPGQESFRTSFEALAHDRFVIGSPVDVAEGLEGCCALGVSHLSLRMEWPGMDPQAAVRSIQLFAREVMPRLKR